MVRMANGPFRPKCVVATGLSSTRLKQLSAPFRLSRIPIGERQAVDEDLRETACAVPVCPLGGAAAAINDCAAADDEIEEVGAQTTLLRCLDQPARRPR